MKKKILAFVMAILMVFSSMPDIQVTAENEIFHGIDDIEMAEGEVLDLLKDVYAENSSGESLKVEVKNVTSEDEGYSYDSSGQLVVGKAGTTYEVFYTAVSDLNPEESYEDSRKVTSIEKPVDKNQPEKEDKSDQQEKKETETPKDSILPKQKAGNTKTSNKTKSTKDALTYEITNENYDSIANVIDSNLISEGDIVFVLQENISKSFSGFKDRHTTVKSKDGENFTINLGSHLEGNVTLDNVTVNKSNNFFAEGYTFETTENFSGKFTGIVYGGSDKNDVANTNLVLKAGTYENVYGGGLDKNVTEDVNITIDGANAGNLFGGGHAVSSSNGKVGKDVNLNLRSGIARSFFGGGNNEHTPKTDRTPAAVSGTVYLTAGYAGAGEETMKLATANISGGGSKNSAVGNIKMELLDGSYCPDLDIVGAGCNDDVNGTVDILIDGGSINGIYGAGMETRADVNLIDGYRNRILNKNNEKNAIHITVKNTDSGEYLDALGMGYGSQGSDLIKGNVSVEIIDSTLKQVCIGGQPTNYQNGYGVLEGDSAIRVVNSTVSKIYGHKYNYENENDYDVNLTFDGGTSDVCFISMFKHAAVDNGANVTIDGTTYGEGKYMPFYKTNNLKVTGNGKLTTVAKSASYSSEILNDAVIDNGEWICKNYLKIGEKGGNLTVKNKGKVTAQSRLYVTNDMILDDGTVNANDYTYFYGQLKASNESSIESKGQVIIGKSNKYVDASFDNSKWISNGKSYVYGNMSISNKSAITFSVNATIYGDFSAKDNSTLNTAAEQTKIGTSSAYKSAKFNNSTWNADGGCYVYGELTLENDSNIKQKNTFHAYSDVHMDKSAWTSSTANGSICKTMIDGKLTAENQSTLTTVGQLTVGLSDKYTSAVFDNSVWNDQKSGYVYGTMTLKNKASLNQTGSFRVYDDMTVKDSTWKNAKTSSTVDGDLTVTNSTVTGTGEKNTSGTSEQFNIKKNMNVSDSTISSQLKFFVGEKVTSSNTKFQIGRSVKFGLNYEPSSGLVDLNSLKDIWESTKDSVIITAEYKPQEEDQVWNYVMGHAKFNDTQLVFMAPVSIWGNYKNEGKTTISLPAFAKDTNYPDKAFIPLEIGGEADGETPVTLVKNEGDYTEEGLPIVGHNYINALKESKDVFKLANENAKEGRYYFKKLEDAKKGKNGYDMWQVAQDESYSVLYNFKSGSPGESIPKVVTDQLPVDSKSYFKDDTVTALKPEKTRVTDSETGKTWVFKGYDTESKVVSDDTLENGEDPNDTKRYVRFEGKWVVEYKINYEFVPEDSSMTLPEEVLKQKPSTGSYEKTGRNQKIYPSKSTFDSVETSSGTWTFDGWDAESKTANKDLTFTGTWKFKKNKYKVIYEFESAAEGKGLPDKVKDLLPTDSKTYEHGTTVNAIQPKETSVKVEDGEWTFKGYDADKKEATGDVKFVGTWEFKKNEYKVTYEFESGTKDKDLPKEVNDLLPSDSKSYDHGSTVTAIKPQSTEVEVKDGVWLFQGWDKDKAENISGPVTFTGKWEYVEFVQAQAIDLTAYEGGLGSGNSTVTGNALPEPTWKKDMKDHTLTVDGKEWDINEKGLPFTWKYLDSDMKEVTSSARIGTYTLWVYPLEENKGKYVIADDSYALYLPEEGVKVSTVSVRDITDNEQADSLSADTFKYVYNYEAVTPNQMARNFSLFSRMVKSISIVDSDFNEHGTHDGSCDQTQPHAHVAEGTKFYKNGNTSLPVNSNAKIGLLYDDLLSNVLGNDTQMSKLHEKSLKAAGVSDVLDTEHTIRREFKYLDLVDMNDGNVWVGTADETVTVYMPYTDDMTKDDSIVVTYFDGLTRDYTINMAQADLDAEIDKSQAHRMEVTKTDTGILFNVPSKEFGPFEILYQKNYEVEYQFESSDKTLSLPEDVIKLLPDDAGLYAEGSTVTPKTISEKEVKVDNGIWTFKGWDADKKEVIGNIKFVGTWEFKKDETVIPVPDSYNVIYSFKSETAGLELPKEVQELLPADEEKYADGTKVKPLELSKTEVKVKGGKWVFKNWDQKEAVIDGKDVTFIGSWIFEKSEDIVVSPETPEKPNTPNTPNTPDTSNTDTSVHEDKKPSETLKTGDYANIVLWSFLMAAAGAAAFILLRMKKRDKLQNKR